jgi:hypothetical protein
MPLSRFFPVVLGGALAVAPTAFAKDAPQSTGSYKSFDALTATVWRTDGRRGVLSVQGGLDIRDATLRARAAAVAPVLRDAYVWALNVYAQSLGPGTPPDADQIGMRLQRATDGVLKRPGAKVLLGTVLVN